ncbi:hypothetical protein [Joostella sp.]|uniref:hypothetical protein n=1 Tax=Joostella sp. TaxID=2231138 RepID=UPI003A94B46E
MELNQIEFPKRGENYLKHIIQKDQDGIDVKCGTVFLEKGKVLPYKAMDSHEIALLVSGKLAVSTKKGGRIEMNTGSLIYLDMEENRKTVSLEDSEIFFFLFKKKE